MRELGSPPSGSRNYGDKPRHRPLSRLHLRNTTVIIAAGLSADRIQESAMKPSFIIAMIIGVALFLGMASSPASAQTSVESVFNGHRIIYPPSSIPQPGRHHTNYFFVDSDVPNPNGPAHGDETPGSLACVYQLVTGPAGCPIRRRGRPSRRKPRRRSPR